MITPSNTLARAHAQPHGRGPAAPAYVASVAFVYALACSLALLANSPRAHAQSPTPDAQVAPQSPAAAVADAPNSGATAQTSKGRAGVITGRVLADGEPLAGARVFAVTASSNRSNVDTAVVADEGGGFRIENLAPGLYTVGASWRGYVPDPEAYPPGRPAPLHRPGEDVTIRLVKGGVVTGTVTGADGEPLVAITVRAVYVRDIEGDGQNGGLSFGEDQTDDRGVYRIFGLRQGVYIVASAGADGARMNWPGAVAPYRHEAPTYYPSGTRDTAEEVTVRAGQEVGGVDIRHRGERGRRITGIVSPAQGALVTLTHTATGTQVGAAFVPQGAGERPFSFEAVADGEYELQAHNSEAGFFVSRSAPQRVVVGGGDVTGLRLTLAPLASVSGSFVVEPLNEAARAAGECKARGAATLPPQESIVAALHEDLWKKGPAARPGTLRRETAPDSSGAFMLRSLEPGRHRFDLRLADDNWYVREVQLPATTTATATTTAANRPGAARRPNAATATTAAPATAAAAARETVELKSGQQLTGLRITVAEGAAALAGRLAPAAADAPLPPPARLRVYLVPAAREQAEDPLRYYEAAPSADGSFSLTNLAPGRYLLLVRAAETETRARPAGWDSATRARLRREAEAAKAAVELQPCQRVNDFAARFPPSPGG